MKTNNQRKRIIRTILVFKIVVCNDIEALTSMAELAVNEVGVMSFGHDKVGVLRCGDRFESRGDMM